MSGTPSASGSGQSLWDFLKVRHGDQLQCRDVHRFEILEKHDPKGSLELFADVGNALDDLLGLPGSGSGINNFSIPKCMYERNLCGLHRETYLDFVSRRGSEMSQNQPTESLFPKTEPSLTMQASSDHDGREELRSPYGGTDETDHNLHDDKAAGLNNNLDGNSNDDDDEESKLPLSADTCDLAEYDKEEVIGKDQVSQHRRQRIEIDEDDVRTLVPVSDADDRAGSMIDSPQSESVTHASRTTPKCIRKQSSRSPSTPKNTPSFLRRYSDKHSAQTALYNSYYEKSPGYRTLRTWTTLSADPSYDEDVEVNEEAVRQRIMAPIASSKRHNPAYGKAGFVYAFRDNELPLIKIGYTAGKLETRKSDIEKSCGYIKRMSVIAAVKVKAYKRLEEIIHQDLAPHRRFFDCACGDRNKNRFTRHQEYFEIDDNTALTTLRLWADFVERQPWEQNPWTQQGTHLKSNWHDRILTPSIIEPYETHDSHDNRIKRWRKFLGIPFPEVEFEVEMTEGTHTSRLTMQSTAQKRNNFTGLADFSKPEYTPSKPPRPATDDIAETVKSAKPNRSFAESLKRSSSSNEIIDLTEQDSDSTAHKPTINLPHRTKNGEPAPKTTTTSSLQAKSTSDRTILSPTGKRPYPVLPGVRKAQKDAGGSSEKLHVEAPSATKGLSSGPVFGANPIAQELSTERGMFSDIQFPTIWRSHSGDNPQPSASSGRPVGIKQSTEEVAPTAQGDLERTHKPQGEVRPSDTVLSLSQKIPNSATMISAGQLMQSMTELATCLLAKEVRPLSARAISADIWQFRWPLACSIAFALHSPYIPAGLSFLMWSVFLPFFVAELRGWAVVC